MSGVLEDILATLKRIEANTAGKTEAAAPAAEEPVKRGRGRPAGSKAAPAADPLPSPEVEPESQSSFLDDEPAPEPVKVTKDDVRAALVAYHKKVNSEQKTRDLLKKHGGVDNLSALPEDKYAAVVAASKE